MPRLAAAPRTKGRGKRGQRAGRIVGSLQPAEEAGQGFALDQQAPPDPYRGQQVYQHMEEKTRFGL
jgi:hypothetical protein